MNREEILAIAKPILFNTDMTIAILEDRKGVTRRLMKPQPVLYNNSIWLLDGAGWTDGVYSVPIMPGHSLYNKARYKPGDYLYVRETWQYIDFAGKDNGYVYKASDNGYLWENETDEWTWRPSIHMPKEAARIFLRVTDVRVEQLQNITEQGAELEGCSSGCIEITGGPWGIEDDPDVWTAKDKFIEVWNTTIPKKDLDKYGWEANPWVWVIQFERVEV